MIPLWFMFGVWLAATIASGLSTWMLYQRRRYSLAAATISVFFASVGMLTFYIANLCCDFSLQTMIAWSRWSISVMGLVILGSSIAGIILNKDKP